MAQNPLRALRSASRPCSPSHVPLIRSPKHLPALPSSLRAHAASGIAPSYSSSTSQSKAGGRGAKWAKGLAGVTALGGVIYAFDKTQNAEAITRTLRTAYYGAVMAIDFKLSFSPEKAEQIEALHERIAKRIHALCVTNGGLYIKLGQSLAIQAAILPKPYRDAFANIFDAAPSVPYSEVVKVFKAEFGIDPSEAFESFEHTPVASASIAQVHKARLRRKPGQPAWKDDEGWVAVKIRKPTVPIQVEWDLFSYRALLWTYEKLFDLPVSFVAKYVTEQMRKEVSLKNEAHNAERAAKDVQGNASLRDRVAIPKVTWEYTGESVMTAEYIKADKLTDKAALERQGLSPRATMDAANALFAAQTFIFGFLHCDPHPGNILVRPHPKYPGKPQIVLIDHGLYISLPEEFRQQYCLLWRSLFVGDTEKIENVVEKWGIAKQNADMFSSMTLLRPHRLRQKKKEEPSNEGVNKAKSSYEAQVGLKDRLRSMLESEELIPRELIFITRTMRMMQANNQALGSPSNRINSMAHYAAAGLEMSIPTSSNTIQAIGLRAFAVEKARLILFRAVLFAIDIGFALTQARQWLLATVFGRKVDGFEDLLQKQVVDMAHDEFGIDLDESAFAG